MKNNKILSFAILCLAICSCGKWLDVTPADQIKEKDLYSTAEGFHNQINGIYSTIAEAPFYGRELSFGLIDAVAQVYQTDAYAATDHYGYKCAAKFDYHVDNAKVMIDKPWHIAYNAIVNCNSIIKYIKTADASMFYEKEFELNAIEGEALALRGMLHFDIMRLYAPSLVVSSSGKYLPYVNVFEERFPTKIEVKDYINNIISDLERAHILTKGLDADDESRRERISKLDQRLELSGDSNQDRFTNKRGYRLNHYAIKALLARVYLYLGKQEEALKYAKELIDLHKKDRWFRFSTSDPEDILDDGNKKLYGDIIFALYNNTQTNRFSEVNPKINSSSSSNYLAYQDFDGIFNEKECKDVRALCQFISQGRDKIPSKYAITTGDKSKYSNNMIPMLRMSEVYYIAAECIYDTDKEQAAEYLNYIREKRGAIQFPNTNNKADFIKQILNEVRRELIGEGQLWFFYKRLNLPIITKESVEIKPDNKFTFPIPDSNNVI